MSYFLILQVLKVSLLSYFFSSNNKQALSLRTIYCFQFSEKKRFALIKYRNTIQSLCASVKYIQSIFVWHSVVQNMSVWNFRTFCSSHLNANLNKNILIKYIINLLNSPSFFCSDFFPSVFENVIKIVAFISHINVRK